jgi:hypothetical protein
MVVGVTAVDESRGATLARVQILNVPEHHALWRARRRDLLRELRSISIKR